MIDGRPNRTSRPALDDPTTVRESRSEPLVLIEHVGSDDYRGRLGGRTLTLVPFADLGDFRAGEEEIVFLSPQRPELDVRYWPESDRWRIREPDGGSVVLRPGRRDAGSGRVWVGQEAGRA